MAFGASVALTWIMFLALFPIGFFWLRRAWRIIVRRDFSEVALKRGDPPHNAAKFAPFAAAINFICGIVVVFVIVGVIAVGIEFDTWSAIAGITLWGKFFADFILSRHAHPLRLGNRA
jgi:hypothetical protein